VLVLVLSAGESECLQALSDTMSATAVSSNATVRDTDLMTRVTGRIGGWFS
jgi:hypothetical protein